VDNQQSLQTDLGYLAGIIDGEGCITIQRTGKERKNGGKDLQPVVIITNCNADLINHCCKILDTIEVGYNIKNSEERRPSHWKTCYWLTICGLRRSQRLLNIIRKYLVSKQGQCELVLRFIESRLNKSQGYEYDESELNMASNIHQLNQKGSQTERRPDGDIGKLQSNL
jgi:hypothetical protein